MKDDCYKCAECGTHYKDKAMASKCREWCRKNPACNPKITSHSTKNMNKGKGLDGCSFC